MKHLRRAVIAAALAVSIASCGKTSPASTTSTSPKATTFVLDEWSIVPPSAALHAGKVAITATNNGKETHELVIVRGTDAASLPKKADGSVNEDKIPESKKAGEIADLAAGKTRTKTLDLPAGDYIAFCNIVENMGNSGMGSGDMHDGSGMGSGGMQHVHFKLGMVNYFTVA
jgi:hypothetical protein